jgi:acylglycerol lipase
MQVSFDHIPNRPSFPHHQITRRFDFVTSDTLTLRGWQMTPKSSIKSNIVIIHGFKDYSERYLDIASKLCEKGHQIFAYDQRGHARSDGARGFFPNFDLVTHDLHLAMHVFRRSDKGGAPWIILGHCIGASIAIRYALSLDNKLAALIISAPALKKMPDFHGFILSALVAANLLAPHMGIIDFPNEKFSRDPEIVSKMNNDMFISNRKIPARSEMGKLNNMEFIQENKSRITIPFLLLHGTNDQINNIEGSREFFEETPKIPGKQLRIYPNLSHDLLHEPEHLVVEKDIFDWLNLTLSNKTFIKSA